MNIHIYKQSQMKFSEHILPNAKMFALYKMFNKYGTPKFSVRVKHDNL